MHDRVIFCVIKEVESLKKWRFVVCCLVSVMVIGGLFTRQGEVKASTFYDLYFQYENKISDVVKRMNEDYEKSQILRGTDIDLKSYNLRNGWNWMRKP